jgi:hypothetical protein
MDFACAFLVMIVSFAALQHFLPGSAGRVSVFANNKKGFP